MQDGTLVYERGTKGLIDAIQDLSLARDHESIQRIVRSAARQLTGADGATFVLRDGDQCFYVDEDAIEPLWKGQRFPIEACISGWSMVNRRPTVIPDIRLDERVPQDAYRPTFVRSMVMVPIRDREPIGAIGNYWADRHEATIDEVDLLQALANSTAVALENVALIAELEQRVADRTAELAAANAELAALSFVDELTGLLNRRGFLAFAKHEHRVAQRGGRTPAIVFADVDGLKERNDRDGHEAGDALLRRVAAGLKAAFRDADLVARLAGDEFAVFVDDLTDGLDAVTERLRASVAAQGLGPDGEPARVSVGVVPASPGDPRSFEELLAAADAAMYADKRARRPI